MKKVKHNDGAGWLLLALVLGMTACLKSGLEPRDFFEVATEVPSADTVGNVRMTGILSQIDDESKVDACGFQISTDAALVEAGAAPEWNVQPPAAGIRSFVLNYTVAPGDARIYFRAFARIGDRYMLSPWNIQQHTYAIGDMVSEALFLGRKNDEATVRAFTVELDKTEGKFASHHGFVYSPSADMPVLDPVQCPDCDTIELQGISGNVKFDAVLPELKFNTTYHVRAFAIVDGVVFYSKGSTAFQMGDGWKAVGLLPDGIDASADGDFVTVAALGRVFGGFGCQNVGGGCDVGEISTDYFEMQLGSSDDSVYFENKNTFPGQRRTNASVFSIGDAAYVFFGERTNQGNNLPMHNFWKYLPQSDSWQAVYEPPFGDPAPFPPARTTAAVFVLDGKAYFAGGFILNENTPPPFIDDWIETSEVWQYNPVNDQWKRMADLPIRKSSNDPIEFYGRRDAFAFSIEGEGYVGGGLLDGYMLKDLWHFIPPTPADTLGEWEYVGQLPTDAKGRTEAVAFSVNKKGYLCSGRHLTDGDLGDLWEFDPAAKSWTAREPLPSEPRSQSFGFALGNYGYLGGGITRIGLNPQKNRIIWRYEPLK